MVQNRNDIGQEGRDREKLYKAIKAIERNDLSSARRLLQEVVANAPEEYVYSYEGGDQLFIKFWDGEEFFQHMTTVGQKQNKRIVWIPSVYPRAYFHLAFIDMENGEYQSALTHLEASLKLEPDQPVSLCEMALAYSKMGDHRKAFSLYEQTLEVKRYVTSNLKARALRGKGIELMDLEEWELAKKSLIESLKYEPNNKITLHELFLISLRRTGHDLNLQTEIKRTPISEKKCSACCGELIGKHNDEFKIMNYEGELILLCATCGKDEKYREATSVRYIGAEVYYAQGEYYVQQERLEESLEAFKEAISIRPDFAEAHFRLGWVYSRFGKYDEAIKAYQEAIHISPHFSEAFLYLGLAYANVDRREESIENIIKAIQLNPNYYEAHYLLGSIHLQHGDYQKAVENLKQAVQINPDHAGAHFGLGVAYQNLCQHKEAIPHYEKALEMDPENIDAWGGKGVALRNLGEYQNAIACFDKVMQINPENAEAWSNKGVALNNLGKYQEGIICLEKALQINPRDEDAWINKGIAFRGLGEYQRAMVCYERALEINPENEFAWCNKGDALENLGKYQEAIKAYENSIKFSSPEFAMNIAEIKKDVQKLKNQIKGKTGKTAETD